MAELTAKHLGMRRKPVHGGPVMGGDEEGEGKGGEEEEKRNREDCGDRRVRGAWGDLTIRNHPTNNWAGPPSPDSNPISSTPLILLQRGRELNEEL